MAVTFCGQCYYQVHAIRSFPIFNRYRACFTHFS